ncbi:hypothetical protein GN958_ATG09388 [Phytophthora infestans]|uniref:Uncharacterized protein n=1 Tax=Phytophthora infestans TaxID=4787 RepID=A0A8S9UPH8_PHYIN|nr:hypothetical protein GN958_ATG09388 [Phytophthora infestans]
MKNHMQTVYLQGGQREIVKWVGILCASNQSLFWACASAPLFVLENDSGESYTSTRGSGHSDITILHQHDLVTFHQSECVNKNL